MSAYYSSLIQQCKEEARFGVFLSTVRTTSNPELDELGELQRDLDELDELRRACPRLSDEQLLTLAVEGQVVITGTEAEVAAIYGTTVGEDGPTKLNPYNGEVRVFALTCGPDGDLITENT